MCQSPYWHISLVENIIYPLQWSRRDHTSWIQSKSNQSRQKQRTGSQISWTRILYASLNNQEMVWCSSHHKTRGIISGSRLTMTHTGCYTDNKTEEVCRLLAKSYLASPVVDTIGFSGLVNKTGCGAPVFFYVLIGIRDSTPIIAHHRHLWEWIWHFLNCLLKLFYGRISVDVITSSTAVPPASSDFL
jgi:hypothetical protein